MLKELGARLHAERRRRGLRQADLARAASVSRPTVIAAEAGRGVSSQSLAALMAALGLDIARLSMPERPLLKGLMRAERERQAQLRLQRKPASTPLARDGVAVHGGRIVDNKVPQTVEQQPRRRPLLKELMAAERMRQNQLHMMGRRERP